MYINHHNGASVRTEAPPLLLTSTPMQNGYTDLPPGKLANVVTYLEMRPPFTRRIVSTSPEFAIRLVERPGLDWYRSLYREIGEPWLWFSRLRMPDDELRAILHDPEVDVFVLVT